MNWADALYYSHYIFATLLLAMSFVHKGYALIQACRYAALFYFVGLLLADTPEPPHWAIFVVFDLALAGIILHLRAPVGAVAALLASGGVGVANAAGVSPALFYDRYEPLALTLNFAMVYYLAVLPRVRPRDRRRSDRLAVS